MFQSFDGRTCELNLNSMFKISLKIKGWYYSQADRPEKREGGNAKIKCECQESFSCTIQIIILN